MELFGVDLEDPKSGVTVEDWIEIYNEVFILAGEVKFEDEDE
jgi:hypothetical protein